MYADTFRNTFFVDVLERLGWTKAFDNMEVVDPNLRAVSDLEAAKGAALSDSSDTSENVDVAEKETTGEKDPFLVEFSGPDDPEHPHNWPGWKRTLVILEVMLLTTVTYMGSAIYTPGQLQIQQEFHVGHVVGTLNLSMYVLGYGLGPLVFSPLSEFAKVGRQPLYILTFFGFAMLQIGCALVDNIAGLVILRFITGVLCSPSLSTGGATVGDTVKPEYVPVFIGLWSVAAVSAPVLGPLLGAAMVEARDWRFIFWLLMWLSSALLIVLVLFFPETSEESILYRRALRLRKITGDDRYYTAKAKSEDRLSLKEIAVISLYRPFKIIIKEPIVLALDFYIALCYGTFYLFFEAFPIVFVGIYNFTLVEVGVAYMGFCVGAVLAYGFCIVFLLKVIAKKFERNEFTPEAFMILAMCACFFLPLSLFLFGWAAAVHWILPIIAEVFFVFAVFNLFQATFSYLAISYPKYLASVFAGNGIFRAGFACAFPLFGKAMFDNLAIDGYPVGWGCSILGFFSIVLAAIPFLIYRWGPYLRTKSSFTD